MLEYYQKALRTSEEVPGLDRPSTAATYNNPGVLALTMGNIRAAVNDAFRAFDIVEKALGKDHPDTQRIMTNLYRGISAYFHQGNSLNDLDDDAVNWIEERIAEGIIDPFPQQSSIS